MLRTFFRALLPAALLALACDSEPMTVVPAEWSGKQIFALTNLHPDSARVMYSLNYQRDMLIPICTPIQVISLDDQEMVFGAMGQQWRYIFYHKYLSEGPTNNINRYFGPQCDPGTVMSPIDQQGIREGRALPGMSKAGVVKAIGYPPPHGTPNLEAPQWRYWKNRWTTMIVHFQGDFVAQIQG